MQTAPDHKIQFFFYQKNPTLKAGTSPAREAVRPWTQTQFLAETLRPENTFKLGRETKGDVHMSHERHAIKKKFWPWKKGRKRWARAWCSPAERREKRVGGSGRESKWGHPRTLAPPRLSMRRRYDVQNILIFEVNPHEIHGYLKVFTY